MYSGFSAQERLELLQDIKASAERTMNDSKNEWFDQLYEMVGIIVSVVSSYWKIIVAFIVFLVFIKLMLKMGKIRSSYRDILAKRYEPGEILTHDNGAFYLGLKDRGGKQTRGRGVLVVTKYELFFLRLHPFMELPIPLKNIQRITTPKSFLDISANESLLQVQYRDDTGEDEVVAWKLTKADVFVEVLKKQRKKLRTHKRK